MMPFPDGNIPTGLKKKMTVTKSPEEEAESEGGSRRECSGCVHCSLLIPEFERMKGASDLGAVMSLCEIAANVKWLDDASYGLSSAAMPLEDYQKTLEWLSHPDRRDHPASVAMRRVLRVMRRTRFALLKIREANPKVFPDRKN